MLIRAQISKVEGREQLHFKRIECVLEVSVIFIRRGELILGSLSELPLKSSDLRNEPTLAVLEEDWPALALASLFS